MTSPRAPVTLTRRSRKQIGFPLAESLTSLPREENLRANPGMATFIEQHGHEILGILFRFDRVVIHRHAP